MKFKTVPAETEIPSKPNDIGAQLIAKAKELDPSFEPNKVEDFSEALAIILENIGKSGDPVSAADMITERFVVTEDGIDEEDNMFYIYLSQAVDTRHPINVIYGEAEGWNPMDIIVAWGNQPYSRIDYLSLAEIEDDIIGVLRPVIGEVIVVSYVPYTEGTGLKPRIYM